MSKDPKRSEAAKRGWATIKDPNEPEKRSEAFRLHLEGKNYQQIADHQGVGRDKARSRVAAAEYDQHGKDTCPYCGKPL